MRILILILLLPCLLRSQIRDDVKHFYAGFVISFGVGELLYPVFYNHPYRALPVSFGVGVSAGYAKEAFDGSRFGKTGFNKMDWFYTFAGSALYGMFAGPVRITKRIEKDNKEFLSHGEIH